MEKKETLQKAFGIHDTDAKEIVVTVIALCTFGQKPATADVIRELLKLYSGEDLAYATLIVGKLVEVHEERARNPKARKSGDLGLLQEAFNIKELSGEENFEVYKKLIANTVVNHISGFEDLPDANSN